jgi:cell division protein FtsQ
MALVHSFILSIIISLLGVYVLRTPDLNIEYVKDTGIHLADSLKVDDIKDKVLKQNILLFNKGAMQRELESIDEIQSVKIGRKFPDTIWVKIVEREPIASLKLKDGFAFIGKDGLAFHKANDPAAKLPVLYAAGCDEIELRKPDLSANFEYAMNALKCVRNESLLCKKISVDQRANMCLNMSSGLLVKLGQPDDLPTKITQLRCTLEFKPSLEREALYVDVSCPSGKVYMPKSVAQKVL